MTEHEYLALLDIANPPFFRRVGFDSKKESMHYLQEQLRSLPDGKKRGVRLQIINIRTGALVKNEYIKVLK